ncbi:MAG TPA: cytochrome c, partial [Gemmatimonadaceae bacterium]|nr:cytochrome c [Gemmatimonadaceae bacterium]
MGSREMLKALNPLKVVTIPLLLGSVLASPAIAQSPTYGVGRTPTAEELRRMDIAIGPTGEELPPGSGTAKEGAQVYVQKACIGCHGVAGIGGAAPVLRSERGADVPVWQKERILPLRSPYATTVWDFINRGMPLGLEGILTPNEVYSLTAYLLFLNNVIPEDQVLDKESLPEVTMPIGDEFGKPHEFQLNAPRLRGYP